MTARAIISSHPDVKGNISEPLVRCVDECYSCAEACTVCADACVAEQQVGMLKQCIRRNLDCADVCIAAGALASRRTGSNIEALRSILETCALACRICAEECERHASQHEHCRICAEACRACEKACQEAMPTVH
jgi:hypothetical protein